MLTRFGVLGDPHQEDARIEAALRSFAEAGVEAVLCTGDLLDGRGDPRRTIHLLEQGGVACVMGNHDRWVLSGQLRDLPDALPTRELEPAQKTFLDALPTTRRFETPLGPMLLCHGLGANDMAGLFPEDSGYALEANEVLRRILASDVRVVVAGHTHRRMVRRIGPVVFINPGTLLRIHTPGFAIVDLAEGFVDFVDVDDPASFTPGDHISLPEP